LKSIGLFSNKQIRFLRDLLAMFFAQVVVKVVGFVAFAYLARRLSQESYGAVEVLISATGLALLLVDFGLGQIGVRELKLNKSDTQIVHEIPTLRTLIALLCLPFYLFFAHKYFDDPEHQMLIYFFGATLVLTAWKQEWFLQASEMIQNIGMGQALRIMVFATLVFLLVKEEGDVLWVGVVEVVSITIWVAYLLYLQISKGLPPRFVFRPDNAPALMRKSAPLGVSSVAWGVEHYVPPIVVAVMAGLTEAALLAVAQRIVTSLQTLSYVYHFTLYTALIERYRTSVEALQELVHASNRIIAWATIGPAVVCAFHAGDLMVIIFGDGYRSAGVPFAMLIFIIPLRLLSGHERWTLTTIGKTGAVLQANLVGAALAVLGSIVAVPYFGAAGAAGAGLASSLSVWATATWLCRYNGVPLIKTTAVLPPPSVAFPVNAAMPSVFDGPGWVQALVSMAL